MIFWMWRCRVNFPIFQFWSNRKIQNLRHLEAKNAIFGFSNFKSEEQKRVLTWPLLAQTNSRILNRNFENRWFFGFFYIKFLFPSEFCRIKIYMTFQTTLDVSDDEIWRILVMFRLKIEEFPENWWNFQNETTNHHWIYHQKFENNVKRSNNFCISNFVAIFVLFESNKKKKETKKFMCANTYLKNLSNINSSTWLGPVPYNFSTDSFSGQ